MRKYGMQNGNFGFERDIHGGERLDAEKVLRFFEKTLAFSASICYNTKAVIMDETRFISASPQEQFPRGGNYNGQVL